METDRAETETRSTAAFRSDAAAVGAARRFVTAWLAERGLEALASQLQLVTSELVTNAVHHGRGDVEVAMRRLPDRVRLEVHDSGGGRPAIRTPSTDGEMIGGWGLRLVDDLVERWGADVRPGHTTVWIEQPVTPA